ncbi:hypothetical protein bcere0029_9860 [Bacillus cereus AH1272]|nr:hypothetical protein bcere0029_9860 [Bacillus cereus AH1272]EEL94876.1 hypothetical protein bcere0030_9830 [Bacillus cereus AH1273]
MIFFLLVIFPHYHTLLFVTAIFKAPLFFCFTLVRVNTHVYIYNKVSMNPFQ